MIYLDNNATTLLDPEVLDAMKPWLGGFYGNPSSIHQYGQRAKGVLTHAQRVCAHFFGVRTDELIFTSGATEALNLCIRSVPPGSHIITSSLEHPAVLEPLKRCGCTVTYLDPEPGQGSVSSHQVEGAIRDSTRLIVLASANSETGVMTDIEAIAGLAAARQIPCVIDAVAHLGKGDFRLPAGVSGACFSGHKIHGPMGIGLAVIRGGFKLQPLLTGGGQQRGLRAGTENIAAIAGFARAIELLAERGTQWEGQMERLRDLFEEGLSARFPEVIIHGKGLKRVCNTSHVAFPGVDGETLVMMLDLAGLAVSHGSACTSGALEPSRVLLSMGVSSALARSSVRFSLSRLTTEAEVEGALSILDRALSAVV